MSDLTNLNNDEDVIVNPNLKRAINPGKEFGIRTSREVFAESDAAKLEEEKNLEAASDAIDKLIARKEVAREIVESVDGDIEPEELLSMVDPNYNRFNDMLDTGNVPRPKKKVTSADFANESPNESLKTETPKQEYVKPVVSESIDELLSSTNEDTMSLKTTKEVSFEDQIPVMPEIKVEEKKEEPVAEEDDLTDEEALEELDLTQDLNIPENIDYSETDDDAELLALDDEDEEKTSGEIIRDRRLEAIKKSIKEKIRPVSNTFDIKTYTVSSGGTTINSSIESATASISKKADWVLTNTNVAITMKELSGETLNRLRGLSEGRTSLNTMKESFKIFYDHIVSEKPEDFDAWCNTVSMFDVPDLYAAAYRASFENVNYLPYECDDQNCDCSFVSDNIPFMDLVKFKDDESKEKFMSIYNDPSAKSFAKAQTVSEIVPISDYFAVKFQAPSIFKSSIEPQYLDASFREKYQSIIPINMCVVEIYKIDHKNKSLVPIAIRKFPNNKEKNLKAQVITLNKIVKTLNADQMTVLSMYINNFSDEKDLYKLTVPAMDCPKCGTKIEEVDYAASTLLFIRHQIAALANG